MPRPEKKRLVNAPPVFNSFKPTGFAKSGLKRVVISLDEYEALRLADYKGLEHKEAAEMMKISRPTFTRLIEKARKKTAEFIIEGAELVIDGGNIHFEGNVIRCKDCGHTFRIKFGDNVKNCPSCKSENLIDIARGYGHGLCCKNHCGRRGNGGRKID